MKAILLAGGKGTRLRPLTIHTPKPIVPIFDRAFLHYQIELLRQVPDIDEIILSLNYQPRRIEEMFGDGEGTGVRLRYVVEPSPLGTGGAIRYAAQGISDTLVVFNGDVMTAVDVNAVLGIHRDRRARATIVLTPVENPSAYGLVETDADGHVKRFLEKPSPDEITCNTINAGIYILEPDTFDRIPKDVAYSIERAYFPSLVERGETFVAFVDRGYWIDIGTPEKYVQVHRDMFDGRYTAGVLGATAHASPVVSPEAKIEDGATLVTPCFVDAGATIKTGATGSIERRSLFACVRPQAFSPPSLQALKPPSLSLEAILCPSTPTSSKPTTYAVFTRRRSPSRCFAISDARLSPTSGQARLP
ncbi:MAG: NDP-sugar synthase [Acidobacteria bacterium]|nr:NDP-sugar synthase [Acidobacteriota bacterium]